MRTITTLALVFLPAPAFAAPDAWAVSREGQVSTIGTWATGLAVGDSNEFTPKYSFLGFNVEVLVHARPDASIGFLAGYQVFLGEERSTVELGDAALNAYQFRYLDTAPLFAVGRYYVELSPDVTFFPALGIGAVYVNRVVDVGIVAVHDDTWHFGVAPQVGLLFHTPGPDPIVDLKYTMAPGGSNSPTEMWFTAEIGLLFD